MEEIKNFEAILNDYPLPDVPDTKELVRNLIGIIKGSSMISQKDKIEIGKVAKKLYDLEVEAKVLRVIRMRYERKFGIRMYANGNFKEIEA